MPSQEEVLRSIYGAWLLARMDESGMGQLNLSVDGFWRSFFAAVLVAPGYALLVMQDLVARPDEVDAFWAFVVEILAYGIGWAAFPLVAIGLTRAFGLSRNYSAMIIAVNWAMVIQIGVFLAAIGVGIVLPWLGGLVVTIVTGAILFYQWFVIRTALQATGGIALVFVLVDLIVTIVINSIAEGLV